MNKSMIKCKRMIYNSYNIKYLISEALIYEINNALLCK